MTVITLIGVPLVMVIILTGMTYVKLIIYDSHDIDCSAPSNRNYIDWNPLFDIDSS